MPNAHQFLFSRLEKPFHLVLVEPEIPPNTGNVARLCAATGTPLHLVGPLGFRIDEKAVRRAGLDYWPHVELKRHFDWAHFCHAHDKETGNGRRFLFTSHASQSLFDVQFAPGDALVFGRESVGLSKDLLEAHQTMTVAIPTTNHVRSHNLANAASIVLYEALRQLIFRRNMP